MTAQGPASFSLPPLQLGMIAGAMRPSGASLQRGCLPKTGAMPCKPSGASLERRCRLLGIPLQLRFVEGALRRLSEARLPGPEWRGALQGGLAPHWAGTR